MLPDLASSLASQLPQGSRLTSGIVQPAPPAASSLDIGLNISGLHKSLWELPAIGPARAVMLPDLASSLASQLPQGLQCSLEQQAPILTAICSARDSTACKGIYRPIIPE